MAEKTFYDIHMHAFNLSHPYLLAFIQRLKLPQILILNSLLGPLASFVIGKNLNKVKNMLAVMENDLGSFFLLIEDYLKRSDKGPLVSDGKLLIGNNVYSRIVLTPLLMDFGYKGITVSQNTYYNELSQKPIVEQVVDVFNGINKYRKESPDHLLEILPFMGLTTSNYNLDPEKTRGRLDIMLEKYFGNYRGSHKMLHDSTVEFDGEINNLGGNRFAGIKVYPPLGFDPWPDKEDELRKVRYLYSFCEKRSIPVTAHGSESGFVVVPKREVRNYTAISKWRRVLENYPRLKLNLAHFPIGEKSIWVFPKKRRLREVLGLIRDYDNVYVDFSCRAINDRYYVLLKGLLESMPPDLKKKLNERILFGSDFTVNLMSIESYNKYLELFSRTTTLNDSEKDSFCRTNPERFLFASPD
ncbi:MAG TPA: amidohydrolase family protein [Dehalococcoidales bacterium]